MKFHVTEMSCGHCTAAITKGIKSKDPEAHVTTDLETRTVSVESQKDVAEIAGAIKAAGYDATPF